MLCAREVGGCAYAAVWGDRERVSISGVGFVY